MKSLVGRLFLLLALLSSVAQLSIAQDATGRVVGTVFDQSGAVISGVRVVVTNVATHVARETTTDSAGSYQVLLLPIGEYTVSASHKGFSPISTKANNLEINQSLRIDLKLVVGADTEMITVEGDRKSVV